MIRFVWSPEWFFHIDALFEVISIVVTMLIALQAFKVYRFTEEKKYYYTGLSFFAISLGLLFKALTNVAVYNSQTFERTLGSLIITYNISNQVYFFFILLLVLYRLFFLLGVWGFFNIVHQSKDRHQLWISGVLLAITSMALGNVALYIFHFVVALILGFIVRHYLRLCISPKEKCMRKMAMAFSLLFLSQVSYIFMSLSAEMYVAAEAFQLLGFILLMMQYYAMVFKK